VGIAHQNISDALKVKPIFFIRVTFIKSNFPAKIPVIFKNPAIIFKPYFLFYNLMFLMIFSTA